MDEAVRFEAVVELLAWGRNTYAVVKVPEGLARSATLAERGEKVVGKDSGLAVDPAAGCSSSL